MRLQLAAIDGGVGEIMQKLRQHELDMNTLLIFTSDNGAPLKISKLDSPVNTDPGGWGGSLNTLWVGEMGMLSGGGTGLLFDLEGDAHERKNLIAELTGLDRLPSKWL